MELLKSGGSTDYLYAKDAKMHFPPVTTDKVLKDGDTVSLGDVTPDGPRYPGTHSRLARRGSRPSKKADAFLCSGVCRRSSG